MVASMVEVSVIIPCYNEENFIIECITSVLNQTFKDFEIVVVDDKSTDRSVQIIESLMRENSRIRLIKRNENGGISVARNDGIRNASGRYICMLSSDDIFRPNYLKTMLKTIERHPNDILYSNYDFIDVSGHFLSQFNAVDYKYYEDLYMGIIDRADRNDMQVNFSTVFGRSEIFKQNLFWEEIRYGEDLEWLLRLCLVEKTFFRLVPESLIKYRLHSSSTTQKKMAQIPLNNNIIKRRINDIMCKKIFEVR